MLIMYGVNDSKFEELNKLLSKSADIGSILYSDENVLSTDERNVFNQQLDELQVYVNNILDYETKLCSFDEQETECVFAFINSDKRIKETLGKGKIEKNRIGTICELIDNSKKIVIKEVSLLNNMLKQALKNNQNIIFDSNFDT